MENPREQAGGLTIWRTEPLLHFPSPLHSHYYFLSKLKFQNLDSLENPREQARKRVDGPWWTSDSPLHSHPTRTLPLFFRKCVFQKSRFFENVGGGRRRPSIWIRRTYPPPAAPLLISIRRDQRIPLSWFPMISPFFLDPPEFSRPDPNPLRPLIKSETEWMGFQRLAHWLIG